VPVYLNGDKTDGSNYRGITLSSTVYTVLSHILQSRLTPYAKIIIGDHLCRFRCNRSIADHIFHKHQTLKKKWEQNGVMNQLFV